MSDDDDIPSDPQNPVEEHDNTLTECDVGSPMEIEVEIMDENVAEVLKELITEKRSSPKRRTNVGAVGVGTSEGLTEENYLGLIGDDAHLHEDGAQPGTSHSPEGSAEPMPSPASGIQVEAPADERFIGTLDENAGEVDSLDPEVWAEILKEALEASRQAFREDGERRGKQQEPSLPPTPPQD